MIALEESLKIANIHADRMESALKKFGDNFPLSPGKLEDLSLEEIAMLELYTSRFAKLQDQLGKSVFSLLLVELGEFIDGMSFIDKLNKLEKLMIIEDTHAWHDLRDIRNHISHEYPDEPAIMAKHLNKAREMQYILLDCLRSINAQVIKLKR